MVTWFPSACLLFTAAACGTLAVVMVINNHRQSTHWAFAGLALNFAVWSLTVYGVVNSDDEASARWHIQLTMVAAAFYPATFYQFIGFFPRGRFDASKWLQTIYWLAVPVFCVGAFIGNWYVAGVQVSPNGPPVFTRGPLFLAYTAICVSTIVAMLANLVSKLRMAAGVDRRQLQHVLLGIFSTALLACGTNLLAPLIATENNLEPYGPVFSLVMIGIFAYSMVRYNLLDLWELYSRTTVYAVITGFVILTFFGSISLVQFVLSGGGQDVRNPVSIVIAAVVIATVLHPLKEHMQLFLDRTILKRRYDIQKLFSRVSANSAHIVRLDQLLEKVATDIADTVGVTDVRVLLLDSTTKTSLVTEFATVPPEDGASTPELGRVVTYLQARPEPIALEHLVRTWSTPEESEIGRILSECDIYLCIPLKPIAGLVGILTLGEKASREMYSQSDIDVLMALAGPLATAIENARLYRKLEEANLHRGRILSTMRGGVIAVDTDGRVTTINQSAVDILGPVTLEQSMETINPAVAQLLKRALNDQRPIIDFEALIVSEAGERIPVTMSASSLSAADGAITGAMVFIYDLTQVKRLEHNVQRADRLSSIGTLAAGMAHEIKNPLVSIKTFTQLMLNRWNDPDFRNTFTEVIPHEVERIDTIVTRLLDFSRPRATQFAPQSISAVVHKVLALVESQTQRRNVTVELEFPEETLEVYGDEQQLHQMFLNLFLNALDALDQTDGGYLRIRAYSDFMHVRRNGMAPLLDVECVKVAVSDTGCGVAPEHVKHLFNPFYTTKENGYGLGLSVVHGIVTEHGGEVDVSSIQGVGTAFTVTLPLARSMTSVED
ncbi:MAG: GAF domain-containing protein [Candidatus Hydrogenedentes bacterium]|nr:GAF domain-containing protein [Candidatus Hydrogenedentota bacterium]